MVPLCPKKYVWPGRESRACCARDACHPRRARRHLPSFPALCPCEPRLPRGEMQAVPYGARSNTWLLRASTSQPPPAIIRAVRKYITGICVFVDSKTVLTFGHVELPRKRKTNTPGQPCPQMLSLLPRRATARTTGERRPVYPRLHP